MALPTLRRSEIGHLSAQTGAVAYVVAASYGGFDFRDLAGEVRTEVPGLRHVIVVGDPGPYTALDELYRKSSGRPRPGPGPQDVALLQLSGGTTAVPKLIPRTHADPTTRSLQPVGGASGVPTRVGLKLLQLSVAVPCSPEALRQWCAVVGEEALCTECGSEEGSYDALTAGADPADVVQAADSLAGEITRQVPCKSS